MSLKKNIIANYASQLYVAGIGILILPLYIKHMGPEAYGLIGFFTMLQAWFGLLDLGLTPTIARETARYHGGTMSALNYRRLFRALSIIFIVTAFLGGGGMFLLADVIAYKWLNISELNMSSAVLAVQIMAISVALRWLGGLYRGVITGSERIVWLSGFNIIIATLRFIAVFISMYFYGYTPVIFFIHQLAVVILEIIGLLLQTNRLKPSFTGIIGWSFKPIKSVLNFALTIAFTSSVWVLVTQSDKLILSGILPLAEYGYFTLAVLVAGGILFLSTPVGNVIMPRLTRLHAEGKRDELVQLYRSSTQLISVLAGSIAITIAYCAETLLFVWTGDRDVAEKAAPILRLYTLGNGILAISAFPYYLQYAIGNLRYHLIGNIILVLAIVPTIIGAALYYGGIGAGYAWLGVNSLYVAGWVGYVHYKLEPGLHIKWIARDCLAICLPTALLLSPLLVWPLDLNNRWLLLACLCLISAMAILMAAISSSVLRDKMRNLVNQKNGNHAKSS